MYLPGLRDYLMLNRVIVFEHDRRIGCEPTPGDARTAQCAGLQVRASPGYSWGLELHPRADTTVVTETFDCTATAARRRGFGEDSIYFDAANNRWTGAVSLGYAPDGKRRARRKVSGRTKTEVRDKLKALHRELDAGIRSSPSYTMALCIEDWLSQGLADRSPGTVANYRHLASHAVAKLPPGISLDDGPPRWRPVRPVFSSSLPACVPSG